jgi:hypothetical protein
VHWQELHREFALLRVGEGQSTHSVPHRLLQLVEDLDREYAGVTDQADLRRDEALEKGEERIDLVYHLPRSTQAAAATLGRLLDEADEYCRQGRELLTLARSPQVTAFHRWYLGQIVDQLDGRPPVPWEEWREAGSEAAQP